MCTSCALMLLETEFATGLFGKDNRLCVGEAASVPLVHTLGKGKACRGGHVGAAKPPALQPGRNRLESRRQREGGSRWLQGKGGGEGIEEVPPITDLWQSSLYLTIYKENILLPPSETDIFCLLGCFAID